ncbi:MAG: hypothetical protein IRZ14_19615 [Chloroflexi bacterium]|nr:hypothetical protein [Chloroflexota bacterium]
MADEVRRGLSGGQRLAVLLVPWGFLVVFALMYALVLWPRAADGHALAIVVSLFLALVFASSVLAAITFSRDVLQGRYPDTSR